MGSGASALTLLFLFLPKEGRKNNNIVCLRSAAALAEKLVRVQYMSGGTNEMKPVLLIYYAISLFHMRVVMMYVCADINSLICLSSIYVLHC